MVEAIMDLYFCLCIFGGKMLVKSEYYIAVTELLYDVRTAARTMTYYGYRIYPIHGSRLVTRVLTPKTPKFEKLAS